MFAPLRLLRHLRTVPGLAAMLIVVDSAVASAQLPRDVRSPPSAPQALAQIDALLADKRARTPVQRKVDSQLLYAARMKAGRAVAGGLSQMRVTLPMTADGRVVLDVRATVTAALLDGIRAAGGEIVDTTVRHRHVAVRLPIERVEALAAVPGVESVMPDFGWKTSRSIVPGLRDMSGPMGSRNNHSIAPLADSLARVLERRARERRRTDQGAVLNVGSATSQGDVTHGAAQARAAYGLTGSGVKIGVLSDGVSNLAASQASGNIGPVTVLAAGAGDEGTAMLEIIADLAPGAQLFFATARGGPAAFAQRIRDLRAAGCDIIVDDVFYFVESAFQDGQTGTSPTNGGVVIEAVKAVAASGGMYFSSAGNAGRLTAGTSGTWEGNFVDGGSGTGVLAGAGQLHTFGSTTFNTVVHSGESFNTLSWSDPLGASDNDYDLFLLDSTGTIVLAASTNAQDGTTPQDPFEIVSGGSAGHRLVVAKYSGASRYLHLSTNGGVLAVATAGQIHGHAATSAANTFAVAATPACAGDGSTGPCTSTFNSANQVERFSSDGPRRIFFTSAGAALTPGDLSATGGQLLAKPDITAADGVLTSVAGFAPFFGTSAAAPHAAAVAGLVKSANLAQTASQVTLALKSTAIDIEIAGWDRDSGAGIVMALRATQAVAPPPAPSGLTLTRTDPTTLIATWTAVEGASSYSIKFGLTPRARTSVLVTPATSVVISGLARGSTYFFAVSASGAAGEGSDSGEVAYALPWVDPLDDFDGDGLADLTVWRPSDGYWFRLPSSAGFASHASGATQWGASGDVPLSGDIDGDGRTDLIVWRPATGTWFWLTSSTGYDYARQGGVRWGAATDVPLLADLDGDSKSDLIVWRPGNGTWYWLSSASGYEYASQRSRQWGSGSQGDIPLLGDFDGDHRADLAVWRASTGTWHWLTSGSGYDYAAQRSREWGSHAEGDRPVLGDLDGDGRSDLVLWRASTGTWFWLTSSTAYHYGASGSLQWGGSGDVAMLGDLDGDRRSDLIVWRPESGLWFWLTSMSGYNYGAGAQRQWGTAGDIPMIR